MSGAHTLARRQLRLAAAQVLQALPGVAAFDSPPVTPTAPKQMPYVGLQCGVERKVNVVQQQLVTTTTTVPLEVIARVSANTAEAAQDGIEALALQIELVLLGLVPLLEQLQRIASVTTTTEFSAEGSKYQAGVVMTFECELFEVFEPAVLNPADYPALQGVDVHVDAGRPYDASGIYLAPPFPDSVAPAPRTSGPDGRDEGTLQIDLPQ